MAKITERQLRDTCSAANNHEFKESPYGVTVERVASGYKVSLKIRASGKVEGLAEELTASEADNMIFGLRRGVLIGAMSKHVYCPKCNSKATLVPEDEFTKEHIFCPTCGQKSTRS